MNLAFIGIGRVGFALANNFQKKGHEIIIAHNNLKSQSVQDALNKNSMFRVSSPQEAIDQSDMIFLATPFRVNEEILQDLDFKSKTLVDCTNPVGPGISHGLSSEISGAEKVQAWAKAAKVVKAYTIYGFENLEDSSFPQRDVKPAMLIAGNDLEAKENLKQLNEDLGFETVDTGDLSQALHLEHMTLLWVKMVRANKQDNFTWAQLRR